MEKNSGVVWYSIKSNGVSTRFCFYAIRINDNRSTAYKNLLLLFPTLIAAVCHTHVQKPKYISHISGEIAYDGQFEMIHKMNNCSPDFS